MHASTLFIDKHSWLHDWHPLTNLAIAALSMLTAAATPESFSVLAFFFLIQIPLAAIGKILLPFLKSTFLVIGPFILSLSLIQGFFTPGDTILFAVGAFTFTQEGLLAGLSVAVRLLVALGATLILMMTTRPDRLMLALREKGLPNALTYIVLTALQIIPSFQDRARLILDAQQARALELEVPLLKRLSLLVPMIGPLLLSSIVDVEERAMALEARAFNYPAVKTQLLEIQDSGPQRAARFLLLVAFIALIAIRLLQLLIR